MSDQDISAPLSDSAAREDFLQMGIPADKLETFMATPEPALDTLGGPIREKSARMASRMKKFESSSLGEEPKERAPAAKDSDCAQFYPFPENKNWVLFNPFFGFPARFPEPNAVFQRYAVYKPGNKRIVLYNLVSGAIGLRSTPESMADVLEAVYEKEGVKVVLEEE